MAARRYEIYLGVLKNISTREDKYFVSPNDHVILFLFHKM